MDQRVFSIAIAALLHDIGKFAQRAERKELYNKNDEGLVLPVKSGNYTHQHALYTLGFLEKYLQGIMDFEGDMRNLARDSASHHNPSTPVQALIALGDQLASGIDRSTIAQFETDNKYYEAPIISVFSLINLPDVKKISPVYLPLGAIDSSRKVPSSESPKLSKSQYSELWDGFMKDWERLPVHNNPEQCLLNLDSILERWTSFIPSATYKTDPDVSLYDHSRVTAALAACSYMYYEKKQMPEADSILNNSDAQWIFVYGDVQGIQKYIFNIEDTKFSSKLLRARSYQIEALCKSAAATIISECGVIPQCELMNGGGNFILVLPNTEETKKVLAKYDHDINAYLLREYLGMLSLNLSWNVALSRNDLSQSNTGYTLQKLHTENYHAKQHKFHSVLEETGTVLDQYYDQTAGAEACDLCGYRPAEKIMNEKYVCRHCNDLIIKSRMLTTVPWMILKNFHPDKMTSSLADFYFYPSPQKDSQKSMVFSVNQYGHSNDTFCALYPEPYSIPHDKSGDPLSFEDIAKNAKGTKKLAMFKADVDNLGQVFKDGLGDKTSISKVASLSRQLHYFFSVELNKFIEANYVDSIYTVYSGGDDICVLGPWDVIFDFASEIQKKFKAFVFNNPSITISAGIALAASSTPVPYIAEEAEKQLESSKHHPGKNAITVFNTTVSWEEFQTLLQKGKEFTQDLDQEKIPTALMRKLLQLGERAENFQAKGDITAHNALWLSHLKYTIARIKEKNKNQISADYWDSLIQFLTGANYSMMWKSRISVCYALYRNRKY